MTRIRRTGRWFLVLLGTLCLAVSTTTRASGKYALVIGNQAYDGADRLTTPDGDAKLIAQRLEDLGFTVALHTNDTRRSFLSDLDAFSREAEGASVVVFYYAGHGFEVGTDNFLMSVDLSAPLNRLDISELRREGISLHGVRAALAITGAQARVLFIDACRTAPERGATARGMHKEVAGNGVILAWSTGPGSAAIDSMQALGKPIDHSPFAWYLANDLAQKQNGIIKVLRLVQEQVSVATDDAQRPWFTSGLIGTLRLAAAGREVATAASEVRAAHVAIRGVNGNPAASENAAARRLWDSEELAITQALRNLDLATVSSLQRRARNGASRAAVILGDAYYADSDSVTRNPARAIRYYRQAVRAGYVPGMTHLGEALYVGSLLPRNVPAAERLFQIAANANETRGTLDLSQIRMERGDAAGIADYFKGLDQAMQTTNDRTHALEQAMRKAMQHGSMVPTIAPSSSH